MTSVIHVPPSFHVALDSTQQNANALILKGKELDPAKLIDGFYSSCVDFPTGLSVLSGSL